MTDEKIDRKNEGIELRFDRCRPPLLDHTVCWVRFDVPETNGFITTL